jgi:hypothetical protein
MHIRRLRSFIPVRRPVFAQVIIMTPVGKLAPADVALIGARDRQGGLIIGSG